MTELGEKLAVAPAGRPLVLRATDWLFPAVIAVDTLALAALPAEAVSTVGVTAREKSLGTFSQ